MGAAELHGRKHKTRITEDQFNELYRNDGTTPPFDECQEPGRLGVVFNGKNGGQVRIWWLESQGHFLETPATIEEARQVLALK